MKIHRHRILFSLLVALLLVYGQTAPAQAADIHVLCSNGLKAVMEELAPQFERSSGNKLVLKFGLAANFKQQIEAGEAFDIAVLTPALIDDLIKTGKVTASSRTVIARTGLGLMIKAGARKSDVSTVDAFKKSLLNAKAIAYAREGASGVAFATLIEKLGMVAALKGKLRPTASGEEVNDLVVRGDAEFGVLPLSEILPVKGAELGGMFPADVQTYITMAAGLSSASKQSTTASGLIKFLMSPAATAVIKAKGMERQ